LERFGKHNNPRAVDLAAGRHAVSGSIDWAVDRMHKDASTYRTGQWRTLTKIIGGAKRDYIIVEGANLNFFAFYMVKNDKY
jgi:hypothetical protein